MTKIPIKYSANVAVVELDELVVPDFPVEAITDERWTLLFTHVNDEIAFVTDQNLVLERKVLTELRTIGKRVELLEYVYPRIVDQLPGVDTAAAILASKRVDVETRLVDLHAALEAEDEVEVAAIAASLRADLRTVRDLGGTAQFRRFAVGLIQDALAFTSALNLDVAKVEVLRDLSSRAMAPTEPLAHDLDEIRERLEDVGFDLFPAQSA